MSGDLLRRPRISSETLELMQSVLRRVFRPDETTEFDFLLRQIQEGEQDALRGSESLAESPSEPPHMPS